MADLTADELLDIEDGFTEWNEDGSRRIDGGNAGTALAEERLTELESELEQDEHPVDYDAELETEEEEAAPVSEKRLKREIRAESIRRLEEAARTESDFPGGCGRMEQAGPDPGAPGNGITKTSVEMCLWNTRRCRNQSSSLDG